MVTEPPAKLALPLTVKSPPTVAPPSTSKAPPTFRFLPIPTPPSITAAPVVLLVDCVVSFTSSLPSISKEPARSNVPPTVRFPLISALSLTSSNPPAESSTRLPVAVVTVLSVAPIIISSICASVQGLALDPR